MPARVDRQSPLGLVLLTLLAEAPMHPYRMQQLIKERGKERVANVAQRNSVYQTIERLQRAGLIRVRDTGRDERRPERTTYELTDAGAETVDRWLQTMLSTPAREFPEFPAALASMLILDAATVADRLEERASRLADELARTAAEVAALPRIFVLEDEYRIVVGRAEVDWLRSVVADLRSGTLGWSRAELESYLDSGRLD
jgi:DNA-binding PadR family transcriptional regulator